MTLSYLVLGALPFIYIGIPNPVAMSWRRRNPNEPMPPDVLRKASVVAAAIPYVQVLLLGFAVIAAMQNGGRFGSAFRASLNNGAMSLALGSAVGIMWIGLYAIVFRSTKPSKERLRYHAFRADVGSILVPPSFLGVSN